MCISSILRCSIDRIKNDYDVNSEIIINIINKSKVTSNCKFIYDQLYESLKQNVILYKTHFNRNIDIYSKSLKNDGLCGFVVKYHYNGYLILCDKLENEHTCNDHVFQPRNINHILTSKYQSDLRIINLFYIELIETMIYEYICYCLFESSDKILIPKTNNLDILKLNDRMKHDSNILKSNYFENNCVVFYVYHNDNKVK